MSRRAYHDTDNSPGLDMAVAGGGGGSGSVPSGISYDMLPPPLPTRRMVSGGYTPTPPGSYVQPTHHGYISYDGGGEQAAGGAYGRASASSGGLHRAYKPLPLPHLNLMGSGQGLPDPNTSPRLMVGAHGHVPMRQMGGDPNHSPHPQSPHLRQQAQTALADMNMSPHPMSPHAINLRMADVANQQHHYGDPSQNAHPGGHYGEQVQTSLPVVTAAGAHYGESCASPHVMMHYGGGGSEHHACSPHAPPVHYGDPAQSPHACSNGMHYADASAVGGSHYADVAAGQPPSSGTAYSDAASHSPHPGQPSSSHPLSAGYHKQPMQQRFFASNFTMPSDPSSKGDGNCMTTAPPQQHQAASGSMRYHSPSSQNDAMLSAINMSSDGGAGSDVLHDNFAPDGGMESEWSGGGGGSAAIHPGAASYELFTPESEVNDAYKELLPDTNFSDAGFLGDADSNHPSGDHEQKKKGKGRPSKGTSPGRYGVQCPVCGKTFNNSSALAKHKLTHSEERKYICQLCSKAFKRQDHLNGHMMTHRSKKPYECKYDGCSKSYCDARSLRRHLENHHNLPADAAFGLPQSGYHAGGDGSSNCMYYGSNPTTPSPHTSPSYNSVVGSGASSAQAQYFRFDGGGQQQQQQPSLAHPSQLAYQHGGNVRWSDSGPGAGIYGRSAYNQPQTSGECSPAGYSPISPAAAAAGLVALPGHPSSPAVHGGVGPSWSSAPTAVAAPGLSVAFPLSLADPPKPVECSVCHRRFKNLPALNGHMRLHGGYMKKLETAEKEKSDIGEEKPSPPSPPLVMRQQQHPQQQQHHSQFEGFKVQHAQPHLGTSVSTDIDVASATSRSSIASQHPTATEGYCSTATQASSGHSATASNPSFTYKDVRRPNSIPSGDSGEHQPAPKQKPEARIFNFSDAGTEKRAAVSLSTGGFMAQSLSSAGGSLGGQLAGELPAAVQADYQRVGDVAAGSVGSGLRVAASAVPPASSLPSLASTRVPECIISSRLRPVNGTDDLDSAADELMLADRKRHVSADPDRYTSFRHPSLVSPLSLVGTFAGHTFDSLNADDQRQEGVNQRERRKSAEMPRPKTGLLDTFRAPMPWPARGAGNGGDLFTRSDSAVIFRNPSGLPAKGKRKNRPEPLVILQNQAMSLFQSRLRSPRIYESTESSFRLNNNINGHRTPPPYTPPPILSPVRSGSGLFWSMSGVYRPITPQAATAAPITPKAASLQPRLSGSGLALSARRTIEEVSEEETGGGEVCVPADYDDEEMPCISSPEESEAPHIYSNSAACAAAGDEVGSAGMPLHYTPVVQTVETDLKPHVNIGSNYQADVPLYCSGNRGDDARAAGSPLNDHAGLLWDPAILAPDVTDADVQCFQEFACCAAVPGSGSNKEYAMHLLWMRAGNIRDALLDLMNANVYLPKDHILATYKYQESEVWSTEEIDAFTLAIIKCDKDFYSIAKEMDSKKDIKQCVEFYYLWKKVCPDEYKRLRVMRKRREQDALYNLRSRSGAAAGGSAALSKEGKVPALEGGGTHNDDEDADAGSDDYDGDDLDESRSGSESPVGPAEVVTAAGAGPAAAYACDRAGCSSAFATKQMLNGHILASHVQTVSAKLDSSVAASQGSKARGSVASATDGGGSVGVASVVNYPCKLCGKVFSKVKSRSAHMKSHRQMEKADVSAMSSSSHSSKKNAG